MKLIKTRKIIFLILTAIVIFGTGCENVEFGFNKVDGNASMGTSTPMENGTLKIYDSNGTLLGETTIKDGKYTVNIPAYSGTLRLVAIDDNNKNVELQAYSEMEKQKLSVKISPLSNVAAKIIYDINKTDTNVTKMNKFISTLFKDERIDTNVSEFVSRNYYKIIRMAEDDNIKNAIKKIEYKYGNTDNSGNKKPTAKTAPILKNFTKSINETIALGTKLGKIDVITGGSPITSFTLSGSGNTNFKIDSNGVVTTKSAFDFGVKKSYSLTLFANNAIGESNIVTFDITIKKVISRTPELNDFIGSIAEGNALNRTIGTVTVLKNGTNITGYTLTGTNKFKINNSGVITTKEVLDYETNQIHEFKVYATNSVGNGPAASVRITVGNVIDVRPILQNFTVSIDDDTVSGTKIGKINFIRGDSNIISFTLSDTTNFSIANNGYVTTRSTFNAKTKDLYSLTLVAKNTVGNSNTVTFKITINRAVAGLAMDKITAYAGSNTKPKPTVQDYIDAGVRGVNATNLNAVNAKMDAKGVADVNSLAKIQTIVNNDPLPTGMTIDKDVITAYIASMNYAGDATKDTEGKIDGNGIIVKVPYTTTGNVILLAYASASFTIATAHTQDNDAGITATLQWDTQNINTGSGVFDAKIIIDDSSATTPDNIYLAKKLNEGENGLKVASFKYALSDNSSNIGTLVLKIIPAVLDRNFNVQTNGKYEHRFMYIPVTNPTTRKTWLNNNLGAEYADTNSPNFDPIQQATTSMDHKAYGSLFQWGRKADGHELIDWTNNRGKRGTTTAKSNDPTDALFIKEPTADPAYWRLNPNDTLWENERSANNVCPKGYRLPTGGPDGQNKEWEVEIDSWNADSGHGSTTKADALASTLKISLAGDRNNKSGDVANVGMWGNYWSANPNGGYSNNLAINTSTTTAPSKVVMDYFDRTYGYSVRCIKD
jgi:uncharacterized protein (TIGR02145 family)